MALEQEETLLAELDSLRARLSSYSEEVELLKSGKDKLESEVIKLTGDKVELVNKIARLEYELEWLRKKVFGRMSEKHLPLDSSVLNEPTLFGDMMSEEEKARLKAEADASEQAMTRAIKPTPRKKPVRKPIDTSNLPVVEEHHYPEDVLDEDGKLKSDYVELGTEVTDKLEIRPASFYVHRDIRHKVALKSSIQIADPERKAIMIAALPLSPIDKGIPGASLLADIELRKFLRHEPFYRTQQEFKSLGVEISPSTMNGWHEAVVEKLKLLYDLLKKRVLSSEYIQMDETVMPVINNEAHKAVSGYIWGIRDGIGGDMFFYYDRGSRAGKVAREILSAVEHKFILQTDGYDGYEQFEKDPRVTLCSCWAHARRKFVEALNENQRLATEGLVFIQGIYQVESEAKQRGLSEGERKALRQEKSYPIILSFERWLQDTSVKVLPKSRIGKAISYTYGLLTRLSRYVNDGRIEIDNNKIENNIRPLALGRKNYLFCANDASAYRTAIMYGLLACCRNAGADYRAWLEDVLTLIPYYRRDGRDMSELLPREWIKAHPDKVNKEI